MTRHLKICHTSDWHLGHTLHGYSREYEHGRFLSFLLDVLVEERCDALVVAGDVFDTGNPPASAQALFYRFLADARARLPGLDVLIIAGNHDSPARLSAPDPILRALDIRVVGVLAREVDPDALLVPLHDRGGETAAWVAAVPYLRPADLPIETSHDPAAVLEGVRTVYGAVLAAARARRKSGQALIATGHCHMLDARPSELSERAIAGALPLDIFEPDVAYTALGHLHYPQCVGGREHVRYSGSPIPLAMSEESYPHQVRIARFERGRLVAQEAIRVPRTVDVLRIPQEGPDELDTVLAQLAKLEVANVAREAEPFLEVRVRLRAPMPDLRQRIEAALADRPVRLVKIAVELSGQDAPLAESVPRRELGDFDPEEVFRRCYGRAFEGEPSDALLAAFREVAAAAREVEP